MAYRPDGSTGELGNFCKPFGTLSGEVWSLKRPLNWLMFILVSTSSRASLGASADEIPVS